MDFQSVATKGLLNAKLDDISAAEEEERQKKLIRQQAEALQSSGGFGLMGQQSQGPQASLMNTPQIPQASIAPGVADAAMSGEDMALSPDVQKQTQGIVDQNPNYAAMLSDSGKSGQGKASGIMEGGMQGAQMGMMTGNPYVAAGAAAAGALNAAINDEEDTRTREQKKMDKINLENAWMGNRDKKVAYVENGINDGLSLLASIALS